MIRLPLKYRSEEDEHAPVDYSFVGSVAEGQRRREGQAIHPGPGSAVVRHRADPEKRPSIDEYGTRARRSHVAQNQETPHLRPPVTGGVAPAQRIAYPEGMEPDAYQETEQPGVQAPAAFPEGTEGGMFDPPVAPEIPEWLRVAQQNNMPFSDRHLRRPQVLAAPAPPKEAEKDALGRPIRSRAQERPAPAQPQGFDYGEAGYPAELVAQQEQEQQQWLARQYGSQRHGAQAAVRSQPERASARAAVSPPPPLSYPPPREAEESRTGRYPAKTEEEKRPEPRRRALTRAEQAERAVREAQEAQGYGPQGYGPQRYAPQSYADEYGQEDGPPRGYEASGRYAPPPRYEEDYADQGYEVRREMRKPRQGRAAPPPDPWAPAQEYDAAPARRSVPWLGIAVSALSFVLVGLWILQMSFAGQTAAIFKARSDAQAALLEKHPYKYRELIETQAQVNNLHPAFIAAIVLNESSFKPQAESNVGARGLMQMMPDTYTWVHGKIGEGTDANFDNMYDPDANVRYACWYMNFLCGRFRGDPVLVAASFHAGQGEVQNWLNDSRYSKDSQTIELDRMKEGNTKEYATRVLDAYAAYKRLYYEDMGG